MRGNKGRRTTRHNVNRREREGEQRFAHSPAPVGKDFDLHKWADERRRSQ
jgi:hypothetical protein